MSYSLNNIKQMIEKSEEELSSNIANVKKAQTKIYEQIKSLEKEVSKNEQYLFHVMILEFANEYPNLKKLSLSSDYESDDEGGSYSVWRCRVEVYNEDLEEQGSDDLHDLIYDSLSNFDAEKIVGYNDLSINFDEIRAIQVKNMLDKNIETPLKREKTSKI